MTYAAEQANIASPPDADFIEVNNALIYLPGFNSGPQSAKSALLKREFPHLIVASYDTWNPDRGYVQLEALIAPHLENGLVLIGSSLGGFWSYHLAARHGMKCVLLNPCMTPEATLRPSVGEVENRYSGEKGRMSLEDLLKYDKYRFGGSPVCTVLHQQGDELIPCRESIVNFQGKAKLILPEGGSHDFEAMPAAIEEIKLICALKHRNPH